MRLKGKTALISGCAINNGRTISLTFAREGADLILLDRMEDQMKQVAKECESLGVKALPIVTDVSKYEEINRAVEKGLKQFGKVDVLVCVAANLPMKFPWDFTYDEWHYTFALNCHSTFYLAKALAPSMIERKSGSIIALGGSSALTCTTPYTTAVAASKHGLHGLIKGLAQAFGPHGVRANMLSLANIAQNVYNQKSYEIRDTEGKAVLHTGLARDPNVTDEEKKKRSPLRRQGTQDEVAKVALFLATDDSSYITGDRIVCAGGDYM